MPRNAEWEREYEKRCARAGEWLDALQEGHGVKGTDKGILKSFLLRCRTPEDPGVLLVVKAQTDAGGVIGFAGGLGMVEALLAWRAKDAAGGLKWRVDLPWEERNK